MEEKKSLYAKMASVMGKVGYIKKRGRNSVQGYDYVMAADIAGEMAKLFAEAGLAFAPVEQQLEWETRESQRGNAMFVCRLKVSYSISDMETGESILIPSFGEGMDSGDKAAYKAMTGALKYALIQTFLIAAGDDPEDETEDKEIKTTPTEQPTKVVSSPPPPKRCPQCGAQAIIKGRPEFGGGYVCYKKFGGCNAKFRDDDSRILAGDAVRVQSPQAHLSEAGPASTEEAGEGAVRETISSEQHAELMSWIETFNVDPNAVLRQYQMRDRSIKQLSDLTPEMFQHAAKVFAAKKEKANGLN